MKHKESKKSGFSLFFLSLMVGVIAALSFNLFFSVVIIDGDSMAPTFYNKDISIIYRTDPAKDKIIVFTPPSNWIVPTHSITYIKRVVGEPGDLIEIKGNVLYINAISTKYNIRTNIEDNYTLKNEEYFVIGDNYENSFDSLYMLQHTHSIETAIVKTKYIKFSGDSIWKSN